MDGYPVKELIRSEISYEQYTLVSLLNKHSTKIPMIPYSGMLRNLTNHKLRETSTLQEDTSAQISSRVFFSILEKRMSVKSVSRDMQTTFQFNLAWRYDTLKNISFTSSFPSLTEHLASNKNITTKAPLTAEKRTG